MGNNNILRQSASRLKTAVALFAAVAGFHFKGFAQYGTTAWPSTGGNYNIAVGRVPMSEGVKEGVTADIPEATPETAREAWRKYIKSYGGKTKGRRDELVTSGANLSGRTVNIYTTFTPSSTGTRVAVFLQNPETKDFLLLTEDQEQYGNVSNLLQQYAPTAQTAGVNNQREKQEKLLKSLNKEYNRLEKNTQSLRKDIEEYKNRINKAEAQILRNEQEMERKREEINQQERNVDYVKDKLNGVPR